MFPIRLRFALTCLLSFCAWSLPAEENAPITLLMGEWTPYSSESAEHGGVLTQTVVEALSLVGLETEVRFLPWKRAMHEVRSGKADVTAGWQKTSERLQHLLFSQPIFHGRVVFFHRKDYPFEWSTIDDLKQFNMAVISGYGYSDDMSKAIAAGDLIPNVVRNERQLFKMLTMGRIDVAPSNMEVGFTTLREHMPDQKDRITTHPKPINEAAYHLVTANRSLMNDQLIADFNKGLEKLVASGRYAEIWSRVK